MNLRLRAAAPRIAAKHGGAAATVFFPKEEKG
jgi:hypothetical protein